MADLHRRCTSKTVIVTFENKIDITNVRDKFINDTRMPTSKRKFKNNLTFRFDGVVSVKFTTLNLMLAMHSQPESSLDDALSYIQQCMPELGSANVTVAMKNYGFDLPDNVQFDDIKKHFTNSKVYLESNNTGVQCCGHKPGDDEYQSFIDSITL